MRASVKYETWYHTPRGKWIADTEFAMMMKLILPIKNDTILDIGCGTGHFSRRFSREGLLVTGADINSTSLKFARKLGGGVKYTKCSAHSLPFKDGAFDHCTAITSLCFIDDPQPALREMLRVARRGITIGLLHKKSLLYLKKQGRSNYKNARWSSLADLRNWLKEMERPVKIIWRTCVMMPSGTAIARRLEQSLSENIPLGGFLTAHISYM
ncbi:hypothetical protein MNBD_NITROSPINAE01-1276 [hydrothermal vent metagenome]|uniref:Methyltransferase type 11 domain-containing protein n=1 Tax=hydrothermal vent metagenome TaxID=652676 RepID=A0A3B1CJ18_9ZZZZ